MMLRSWLVRQYDAFVREPRMVREYYTKVPSVKGNTPVTYIYMADGRAPLGGMFDRLKGMITVYALSKVHGADFRIHFTHPFRLSDYLLPAQYDWRIAPEDVCYTYPAGRPIFAFGEYTNPKRLLKRRTKGQYHFYYGYNSLADINRRYHTDFDWSALYHELFQPATALEKAVDNAVTSLNDQTTNPLNDQFVVIHTRFLNLLGDKMETDINPVLPQDEQESLISQTIACVERIARQHQESRVLMMSDSTHFLREVEKRLPYIMQLPGEIVHVGTAATVNDDAVMKMFVDYNVMARAKKVYSIAGEGMWNSAFPEYAAKIGRIPFERITL